jgi:hypothetical protein
LQDTAKNKLINLKCISSKNNNPPTIHVEGDDEESDNDLKGDVYDIKNSARKNKVNHMEFESGKPFISGKSSVTISVDKFGHTNNVATLKLNLLKL